METTPAPAARRPFARRRAALPAAVAALALASLGAAPSHADVKGRVVDADGAPVAGAMVTLQSGVPFHAATVFSDDDGRFVAPAPHAEAERVLRVRRLGWRDRQLAPPPLASGNALRLVLERETDPARMAAQLPAHHWLQRVVDRLAWPWEREEFKRQCGSCHQQGSAATRLVRDEVEWRKILLRMDRLGGTLSSGLRDKLPALLNEAYDPATAVPELTRDAPWPAPPTNVRRAVVEEWQLGQRSSRQRDLVVHPDGRVYAVDANHDRLYRLDPSVPGGERTFWPIPTGDSPPGGAARATGAVSPATSTARVGPHSLQVAPDGSLWITLALGNRLARFDPETEGWRMLPLEQGAFPHTLRFDEAGRAWYTIAASNHVGMVDPTTGETAEIRLPAGSWSQSLALRAMPLLQRASRYFDLREWLARAEAVRLPLPVGIDIGPGGIVWFSQLNQSRIGRLDPVDHSIEMIDTPFAAPRRLRFDSRGRLWIPSFADGLVARFDPETRAFRTWPLPTRPAGGDLPYALAVDPATDDVWICGSNSDSLIRFEPERERFTVFPLPTRVTYTREIDFDAEGRVWTSNSNTPAWQIESGVPRVLRVTPTPPEPGRQALN